MKVISIRKIRNQPSYKLTIELEDEEKNTFLIVGMNRFFEETGMKVKALSVKDELSALARSSKTHEINDKEENLFLGIAVNSILADKVGIKYKLPKELLVDLTYLKKNPEDQKE